MERKSSFIHRFKATLPTRVGRLVTNEEAERFLIQRKFDFVKASEQLIKRCEWYMSPFGESFDASDNHLRPADMLHFETPKEQIFSSYELNSFLGEDREGNPIYWERSGVAALHWNEILRHVTEDEAIMRHVLHMEITMERCRQATLKHGHLINQQTIVMDLAHFPLFPSMSILSFARRVHEIDRYMYPETLRRVLLINTPSHWSFFFHLVKPFIGKKTLEKIVILGSDYREVLEKHIAKDYIPVEYGGSCETFSWQWPSNLSITISSNSKAYESDII